MWLMQRPSALIAESAITLRENARALMDSQGLPVNDFVARQIVQATDYAIPQQR